MKTPIPISSSAPGALGQLAAKLHQQSLRTVDEAESYADDMDWAIAQLDAILERLEPHARLTGLNLGRPGDPERGRPFYLSGVLVGPQHPMSMPVEIETINGVTRGRLALDIAWEGPPDHVHGGYVSHLFDCVMGQHNLNVGIAAMTGTLTVRYRRPTRCTRSCASKSGRSKMPDARSRREPSCSPTARSWPRRRDCSSFLRTSLQTCRRLRPADRFPIPCDPNHSR